MVSISEERKREVGEFVARNWRKKDYISKVEIELMSIQSEETSEEENDTFASTTTQQFHS